MGFECCGEGGIRTPGTLIEYVSLANWWIKPLSHLSGDLLNEAAQKYKNSFKKTPSKNKSAFLHVIFTNPLIQNRKYHIPPSIENRYFNCVKRQQ
jgi:hypothetical protein